MACFNTQTAMKVLVLNCGSSTVKFQVIETAETSTPTHQDHKLASGLVDHLGGQATFKEKTGTSDMNILSPIWGIPMVAYGPGDSRYDHTPMERLTLADYTRSITVLKGVIRRASDRII